MAEYTHAMELDPEAFRQESKLGIAAQHRNLANAYQDEEFSKLRDNPTLHEGVPPPPAK